jgi:paraquat-inducible protein A
MNGLFSGSQYIVCKVCSHPVSAKDGLHVCHTCERCGHETHRKPKSAQLTVAFSLTALIFYLPANLFPFMTVELYGNRNSATIWGGIVDLANSGSWFIAIVVFLASLLIPLLKLLILFYLAFTAHRKKHPAFKTKLYHFVEAIGRWSMLDIFLLAVLVALMKLGKFTTVEPEIGSGLFLLVVIFTMLASAYFDPQLLWEDEVDDSSSAE